MEYFYLFSTIRTILNQFPGRLCRAVLLVSCGLIFTGSGTLWAEGTKQLAPNPDEIVMLLVDNDVYGNFAAYDGPENSRLYFRINDPGEVVYLGLSRNFRANGQPESTGAYNFRIRRRSDGAVVHGPFTIHAFNENVSNWEDATLGPAAITGQGYETTDSRYFFDPQEAGDYFIEFEDATHIGFWDITVAGDGAAKTGRIFSMNWAFRTPADQNEAPECVWDREFNGILYSYTSDGFVTRIDFSDSGFQGLSFNVAFNRTGPGTSGDPQLDRMSVEGQNLTENSAEHLIFLNEPDPTQFPDGECGAAAVAESFLCTDYGGYCLEATVSRPGQVEVVLDFNQNGVYDNGLDVRLLEIFEDPGSSTKCINWDGLKGDGTRPANGETVNLLVQYTQGVQHWALFDGEFLKNGFCVEPVRPICDNGQSNLLYWDDRNITDDPGTGAVKDGRLGCDCTTESCRTWNYFDPNTEDCRFINDNITLGYGDKSTLNTWWFARNVFTTYVDIPFPAGVTIEGETEICENAETTLEAITSSSDIITITWEGPAGIISEGGAENTQITVSEPGMYTVTVAESTGCTTSASHELAVIVCPVDVELDKLVDVLNPEIGQVINYEIALTNHGPGVATGIRVEDLIPDGLTEITAISDGGMLQSDVIVWTGLALAEGQTIVLSYRARVTLGLSYTNLAEITSMDQEDIDSTPGNGVDTNNNGEVADDPGDEDDGDGVVLVPQPCSMGASIDKVVCDDNGTPVDPSDDTFTFEVTINAANASTGWIANDPGLSTGVYGQATKFGPYRIADGIVSFQVQDQFFGGVCSIPISVNPPATCSDQCLIETEVSQLLCNDNGTPSDPNDDTYTFDLTVTGFNTGESWSAGTVSAAYGQTVSFGPFAISDGPTYLTITDIGDGACKVEVVVQEPLTCSGLCEVEAAISNIICDDNGTPSHPEDDVFYFDILVEGANVGAEGWTCNFDLEGSYGEVLRAGPFPISGGDLELEIRDKEDAACTVVSTVNAPASCSDECLVEAVMSNLRCEDNGTLSDPDDDIFFFDLMVTGLNTGDSWSSNIGISGSYGTLTSFGPYLISDGAIKLVISDESDPECTFTLEITPPNTCSNVCAIEAAIEAIYCDDNGTASNPTDDVYFADILVTGANTSEQGFTIGEISGQYNVLTTVGPFPIADGDVSLEITDAGNSDCLASITLTAPETTCSEACELFVEVLNIQCDDNGTPSLSDDDTFTFDVIVNGFNYSGNWQSAEGVIGNYGEVTTLGPFPVAGGTVNTVISDLEDAACTVPVSVEAPPPCSDACEIISTGLRDLLCDDNGTPTDPSDDTYSFVLVVTGYNVSGEGWSSNLGVSGEYNTPVSFGPYPIREGGQNIVITDKTDPECQTVFNVPAPPTCSEQCAIEATILEVICLDNGTPSHADDDLFQVRVIVSPINNPGTGWIGSGGVRGVYGEEVTFGPYPIRDGNRRLVFNSLDFVDCRFELPVEAPEPCSDQCLIEEVEIISVDCDDNNTPGNSLDDLYTYTVVVNGLNLGESWTASDGTTGAYGVPVTSVPHPAAEGAFTVTLTDDLSADCAYEISVSPPPITIECPEDAFRATVPRNALVLEGRLEETDARFAKVDDLCWMPNEYFESGDHYYDRFSLRYNSEAEEPEIFTFYLFSDIPGNADLTLGLDGAGGLFLGPYYPDDPCCFLQSSDVRATATELPDLLENPLLDPSGLFSKPYSAVAKFSVLMAPNEVYTLLTTTFLQDTEGDYAWLIVSRPEAELEVVNGDIAIENRQQLEVGMELTFFDRDFVLDNPESTDALGYPQLSDYCGVDSITFDDRITDLGECSDIIVHRKFKVYGYGNPAPLDSCEQDLTLRRPDLDDIILPPEAILYACGAVYDTLSNGNPAPSAAGFPMVLTQSGYAELSESFNYNLTIAYKDNVVNIPGDFTKTFNRDWTITDVCNDTLLRYSQLIKIGGFTDPIVECPVSNHYCPILEGNIMLFPLDPFACTATVEAPLPDIINTCGEQNWMVRTEVLQVVGDETLVLATFEPGEERVITDLPPADYLFRYTVFDNEDHSVERLCVFRVADTQEPAAICRTDLDVTISEDGPQRIFVDEINQGSYDNCEVAKIEVRRVFHRDPATCALLDTPAYSAWGEFVEFSCCDIDQKVTVEMRVTDIYGIENMCWLDVPVTGSQPVVSGLGTRNLTCSDLPDDFDAADTLHLQAVFGLPQVDANCPGIIRELSPLLQLTECGVGSIQRRFQISRLNGLLLEDIYTQTINIEAYLEYEIGFPADAVTDCLDLSDTLILRKTACDSLEVTFEDERLDPVADECYRVARTYHVISHCEWDGISDPVLISRDEDCNGTEGEERTWVLRRPDRAYIDSDTNENNTVPAAGTKGQSCDGETNEAGLWKTAESTGYWVYTQVISVYDEQPPVITFEAPDPFCTVDARCEAEVIYPFTADDACVIETFDELNIGLDIDADGTLDQDLTDAGILFGDYPHFEIIGDFPIGSHQFVVTAIDVCGNATTANLPFTVIDCFVATPVCTEGLTVDLALLGAGVDIDGDGTADIAGVTVNAADLITYDPTECTNPLRISLNHPGELPDINRTSIGYTCDDRYTDSLEVYIWDSAFNPYRLQPDSLTQGGPNYKYCTLQIRIEDPEEVCPDCDGSPVVGGTVTTEGGDTPPMVEMEIENVGMVQTPITKDGGFQLSDLASGGGYVITPHWDQGVRNGVSTLDLMLARAHILGLRTLDSPYKLIAADVNNSGNISALDLIEFRRVLLGEADRFTNNTSWRFVDRKYTFPDALNPWSEPFPESVVIDELVTCINGLDFAAIKIGDLDGSARFESEAFAGNRGFGAGLTLEASDPLLESGTSTIWTVELPDPGSLLGFQFTLSFDPELVEIEQFIPGLLTEDQTGMRFSREGVMTFSWDRDPKLDLSGTERTKAFSLKLRANTTLHPSEVFRISSRVTPAEAYRTLEGATTVNLQFEGNDPDTPSLKLYQNRPNPFGDYTIIAFDLPTSGPAEVQLMDVSGRSVWQYKGDFAAGYNELKVSARELPGSGMYYYLLRTPSGSLTRKLIVL
ncbi:T9SS type A sorting domain-containing protein [Flavilitoribacter nigricans]|uniref:Uncharacterized protein n=1 Tax=Flavilitoribacter nigricans (strain ATCC 23147 / DSM 23189 / NBRC 102662 / NCIMB 1420 / SS-2) TaxID=1122177 RepID=A0A2D0N5A6_FLAN2|nr:T9SS type A sorting domain-containing protein [Flavilitoribacter nigricans]PHN03566.1 hypothetical protein CRP01_26575 [Flavilitoribacter nigricans DSM 23189 = NBRC 102662]